MKFALPATLYAKLRFFEDPAPLAVPYESTSLYVEPCALLSPLAASNFYELCKKIPLRLGPLAADEALHRADQKKRGIDIYNEEPEALQRRRWPLFDTPGTTLKEKVLEEAAGSFAIFARCHPNGVSEGGGQRVEKFAAKDGKVYTKTTKAAGLAGDLVRNLRFAPPSSHQCRNQNFSCVLQVVIILVEAITK